MVKTMAYASAEYRHLVVTTIIISTREIRGCIVENLFQRNEKKQKDMIFSGGDGLSDGLISLLRQELLRVITSDAAEELPRFGLGNAIDELDTTGEGLVRDLVVGDMLGDNILQLSLFLGVFGDESGSLLLGDDEGERQLSMELVGDPNDADLGNERMFAQMSFHLGGSDLETADFQHLLETVDDEDFHVLVDRDLVTGADPTVDEGFLSGLLIVAVTGSHRRCLDD